MLPLFARAGLSMVPGATRLPFVAGGGRELPDLELGLEEVATERERLAAYCRVCDFTMRESLPATYPHMLAFPLHLALMTDPSFPFPAIGLVHIENRITQRRPIGVDERLSLRVRATRLEPHPRGQQFTIVSEATAGGELVWQEESVNLKRGSGPTPGDAPKSGASKGRAGGGAAEGGGASWKLPGDLGRRYAGVSGDYNPIHVHSLSAKLFGFPTAIAHGMWIKARCLAALEAELPDAFAVEVAFKRPILLPATVEFAEGRQGDTIGFAVRDAGKGTPHLEGAVTPPA